MITNRLSSGHVPHAHPARHVLALLCAAVLFCAPGASTAHEDRDHDRARQAVAAGEVLPLPAILERVEREIPGKVLDVELERENHAGQLRWVYKLKVLRSGGSLVKIKLDARNGAVIGRKASAEESH